MAKRVRGSRSTHRPGGQGPSRTGKSDTSTAADEGVSQATADDGIDAAIDTIDANYSEIAIEEAAPVAAPAKSRRARRRTKTKPDDLAARAAAENVWVREDLRRIGVVSVILVVGLALAWVVFVPMDLLNLY